MKILGFLTIAGISVNLLHSMYKGFLKKSEYSFIFQEHTGNPSLILVKKYFRLVLRQIAALSFMTVDTSIAHEKIPNDHL